MCQLPSASRIAPLVTLHGTPLMILSKEINADVHASGTLEYTVVFRLTGSMMFLMTGMVCVCSRFFAASATASQARALASQLANCCRVTSTCAADISARLIGSASTTCASCFLREAISSSHRAVASAGLKSLAHMQD